MKRQLTHKELELFKQIARMPQKPLKKAMYNFLKAKYSKKNVCQTHKYIYAEGDIPIAVVCHLDTVFKTPPKDIYYDREFNVIWSPDGLGADDRAGVFGVCQLIKNGFRPHIIMTTDEEVGGIGAAALAQIPQPFKDLRYIIELDRRGAKDCVFYDCDNPDFTNYIQSFGFAYDWGSFSDISFLAPAWGVAAVNLSIGYEDEHSISETFNITHFFDTIQKVEKMLAEEDVPSFKFIEKKYPLNQFGSGNYIVCNNCQTLTSIDNASPVEIGHNCYGFYCLNCLLNEEIKWCSTCGSPYLPQQSDLKTKECRQCAESNT